MNDIVQHARGQSTAQIAALVGRPRGAVFNKIERMGLRTLA